MPIKDIANMARERGVDVIVDAAHSWGQIDFKVGELDCDFVGFNLHKWIGAPLGVGFMYIRKPRLADIDRAYGDEDFPPTDIRSRVHTGTSNFAASLALPTALQLHQAIGPKAKELRLRHLRDHWVSRTRGRGQGPVHPHLAGALQHRGRHGQARRSAEGHRGLRAPAHAGCTNIAALRARAPGAPALPA